MNTTSRNLGSGQLAGIFNTRGSRTRWQLLLACGLATIAWTGAASPALAALASYVFFSENNNSSYGAKFDGSSTTPTSFYFFGGSPFASNSNSSGGGLSLLTQGGEIFVANPGTPAGGAADLKLFQVTGNSAWAGNPVGRHGTPNSNIPSLGIFRGTITGGVSATPSINTPASPLSGQSTTAGGVLMGDFAHDIFTGSSGNTYIAAHNSDAYIDLGTFAINRALQVGNGAIIEKTAGGGVWYVNPTGAMTQLINPQTLNAFTVLDNSIGGKVNDKGFFNADGKAWYYDATANTVGNWSGANLSGYVRVGGYGLAQDNSGLYLWSGSGAPTEYASGPGHLTAGISFGDYAFGVIDGATRILRDNGSGIDNGLWASGAYDVTQATGGYLGVINEVPEPSSLVLLLMGAVALLRRRNRR